MVIENDKYGTRARQLELLSMFKEVDKLFRENGIRYSLGGGSVLGAVRHNGFIPWDDDIDLMVDRENYAKIIELFGKGEHGTRFVLNKILWVYRIQDKDDKSGSIMTPTIDIFVIDNYPDNAFVAKFKLIMIKLLQGMMKTEKTERKLSAFYRFCLFVTRIFGKLFTHNFKFKLYDRIARIGNGKKSRLVTCYFSPFSYLKFRFDNTLMDEIVDHEFEDTVAPIVAEYDKYLTVPYGDYMTPPKEEDRVSQHVSK